MVDIMIKLGTTTLDTFKFQDPNFPDHNTDLPPMILNEFVFVPTLSVTGGTPAFDMVFASDLTTALPIGITSDSTVQGCDAGSPATPTTPAVPPCTMGDGIIAWTVVSGTATSVPPVTSPEPSAFLLLGAGLVTIVGAAKSRLARI
jgi:hypothetical protein